MSFSKWRHRAPSMIAVLGALLWVWSPYPAGAAARQTIAVFGDSLSWQAHSYLATDFSSATTVNTDHVFPGTAVCSWLPTIKAMTASSAPRLVVLEFVGNVSPCDGSVTSPTALAAAYKSDLSAAVKDLLAVGVHMIVIDEGPRVHCTAYAFCAAQPQLHDTFEHVASSFGSSSIVYARLADRAVETSNGRFTVSLQCLATEVRRKLCAQNAQIKVRSGDGVHFCPVANTSNGVMQPCPVYASGAYRFATGIAKTIWALDPSTKPTDGTTKP